MSHLPMQAAADETAVPAFQLFEESSSRARNCRKSGKQGWATIHFVWPPPCRQYNIASGVRSLNRPDP
eukprot:6282548-Alexandrium_andersonii.AAC.1